MPVTPAKAARPRCLGVRQVPATTRIAPASATAPRRSTLAGTSNGFDQLDMAGSIGFRLIGRHDRVGSRRHWFAGSDRDRSYRQRIIGSGTEAGCGRGPRSHRLRRNPRQGSPRRLANPRRARVPPPLRGKHLPVQGKALLRRSRRRRARPKRVKAASPYCGQGLLNIGDQIVDILICLARFFAAELDDRSREVRRGRARLFARIPAAVRRSRTSRERCRSRRQTHL